MIRGIATGVKPRARQAKVGAVSPVGQGTITTIAPADISQCAIDCSTYCSVLFVNKERAGSAWEKQETVNRNDE